MPRIAAEFRFPAMTQSQYDALISDFELAEAADPGIGEERVIHLAMPDGDGWFVFDVWESPEAFERMGAVLMPIFQQHGMTPTAPKVYPVHHTMS